MIALKEITKKYQMGSNTVFALRGVSLEIQQGDFVAIMGPSGSGKSTLMHLLGLLDRPDAGSYLLLNREIARLSEDELAVIRRDVIGFIFQQFNLLPRMSAAENVTLPLLYSQGQLDFHRAQQLLKSVNLESRAYHRPNELSGGQQQRVAIARSLINHPLMILADEPTGNLDSQSERDIMGLLEALNSQGITVIIVTHEEEIGLKAHRLIRMRDGVIQSDERLKPLLFPTQTPLINTDKESRKKKFFDFVEYFKQGLRTLMANKVRSALSMLGILIGVGAVVAMLALGRGAQKAIEDQLSSLGSNLLVLRAGNVRVGGVVQDSGSRLRITTDDASDIAQKISAVKEAAPAVNGRAQVTFQNKNWNTQVLGSTASYAIMHASMPEQGRFFTEDENKKRARVAIIGATVVREVFGELNPLGDFIKINKVSFQVIGVLPEKGATGFRDQDDVIVIPVLTAMHRLLGKTYVDYIDIEIKPGFDMSLAQEAIESFMLNRHKIPISSQEEAFQVRNMADIQEALSSSSRTMSVLLASIAAISLLVGGIGIMNIMLVSVTERTREIGLRKAVGARRWDILSQFLAEAVVVSVMGGLLGIFIGWMMTFILSKVFGWATSVTLSSVTLAFGFSAGIGIIFGIYPARQASLLNPIEALRHE